MIAFSNVHAQLQSSMKVVTRHFGPFNMTLFLALTFPVIPWVLTLHSLLQTWPLRVGHEKVQDPSLTMNGVIV